MISQKSEDTRGVITDFCEVIKKIAMVSCPCAHLRGGFATDRVGFATRRGMARQPRGTPSWHGERLRRSGWRAPGAGACDEMRPTARHDPARGPCRGGGARPPLFRRPELSGFHTRGAGRGRAPSVADPRPRRPVTPAEKTRPGGRRRGAGVLRLCPRLCGPLRQLVSRARMMHTMTCTPPPTDRMS
jgi:hypothetical protein